MKLSNSYSLVIAFALFLVSCDCGQVVKGIILNKRNKEPIGGVKIEKAYSTSQSIYCLSDSTGHFNAHYIAGSVFTCPDFQLLFSKEGYTNQKMVYNGITLHDTIYLEKVK